MVGRVLAVVALPAKSDLTDADNGLSAVGYLELGEDVRDIVANGLQAEVEPLGDLPVVAACGYEVQDLALGRRGEGVAWRLGPSRRALRYRIGAGRWPHRRWTPRATARTPGRTPGASYARLVQGPPLFPITSTIRLYAARFPGFRGRGVTY